ncbi:MAG: protein-glutamate O-methyltransferase CheR [Myxococcales bacterium]
MARLSDADGVVLRPEEFRLLRDLFSARTGIAFGPESRFAIERRLRERLAVLNLANFSEYYHFLRFNPLADAEWDEALDLVTTNETYFFREDFQLRAFRDEVLPLLANQAEQSRTRRLSIWSAGCSTGEEVYSIAILIHQSGLFSRKAPNGEPLWDVRVHGSDISRRCVANARRAVYAGGAFRVTPPEVRRDFFEDRADGFHVIESIRDMCHFGQMNLLHADRARVLGNMDAIFCRNMLIYFDAPARKQVISTFHERLLPGGVLLLGHSESLLNVSTAFELLHLRGDLIYRKPPAQFRDSRNPGKV